MVRSRDPQSSLPTTYSCASGETSPPETAGGSRRRLTAKRRRLILPTYVNRICHDYTRGSGKVSERCLDEPPAIREQKGAPRQWIAASPMVTKRSRPDFC